LHAYFGVFAFAFSGVTITGNDAFARSGLGEIGRRARLRIAKSLISKHRLPFQIEKLLRAKNRLFSGNFGIRE
jgi:hypothetical protein